jgi:hypothetical protein
MRVGWCETAIGENDREPSSPGTIATLYRLGL